MASGSIFSGTLQTITNTKLEELSKQHLTFTKQRSVLLTTANAESDPVQRLNKVVDGTKRCLGVKTSAHKDDESRPGRVVIGSTRNNELEKDLVNVDRFLDQARFDPSVSPDVLKDWEEKFMHYVTIQATKYEYADLYGKLVTEWLSSEKAAKADDEVGMGESFQEFPSAKKLEARKEWEKYVFEPASVDVAALKDYLERLFITDKREAASALSNLQKHIKEFEESLMHSSQFSPHTLRWVIKSLQTSDLLSNEKREVLRDFLSNEVILLEIADVLNTRLESLDQWSWGEYVLLEQQRQINGQFQVQMNEDILQAIFLHYIGVKWSVCFKTAFLAMRKNPKTWKTNRTDVPKSDKLRRAFFLGNNVEASHVNLDNKRSNIQRQRYFTSQLLDREEQQIQHNDGEEEADYADFVQEQPRNSANTFGAQAKRSTQSALMQSKAQGIHPTMAYQDGYASVLMPQATGFHQTMPNMRPNTGGLFGVAPSRPAQGASLFGGGPSFSAPNESEEAVWEEEDESDKNPMDAKQGLLHILATEIMLNTHLNGEMSCFRTTFESWNSLLPHETILVILEFFGVSDAWKAFFKTFLQAPLKFAEDHESSEPRLRRRGTPAMHALSDVFGEAVLFCLDFSTNQSTNGALLHRLYDDVWFWNKDYEVCATAWAHVEEFAGVTGTQIDRVKSGSIRVSQQGAKEIDDRLPPGEIRWGFLYLNPTTGHFDIDHKMVDSHIKELRQQLKGKSKSIIDWIQTWNSYAATFFSTNFGKAANCFGREHIDTMLATHRRIQESVFDGGNVVQYLKQMIRDRFSVSNLPDGFLYFPVELGGLDLKSPFVGLLQIRDSVKAQPYDLLKKHEVDELDDYHEAKQRFEKGTHGVQRQGSLFGNQAFRPTDADVFFSMAEYTRYRESLASTGKANLLNVFMELLKRPEEEPVDPSKQVEQALAELSQQSNLRGILSDWWRMDAYWKWVAQMYGPDMISRFGGFNVVDPGWLPIGMVSQFRQRRTKWQG
ncbi:hypothetical protein B5807_09625 [Epicoccum nigrum]|uniref:Reverse transcriptase domain-containing protein n=1 Tax=Epicoccum nigrum TaxID=105696 RepID=A0A1Y2LP16_EPING|nr:hypothetical protein B5807_09625 [Epicoccum nigrum]